MYLPVSLLPPMWRSGLVSCEPVTTQNKQALSPQVKGIYSWQIFKRLTVRRALLYSYDTASKNLHDSYTIRVIRSCSIVYYSCKPLKFLGCRTENDFIDIHIFWLADGKCNHTGKAVRTDSYRSHIIFVRLLDICFGDMLHQFCFNNARTNDRCADIILFSIIPIIYCYLL